NEQAAEDRFCGKKRLGAEFGRRAVVEIEFRAKRTREWRVGHPAARATGHERSTWRHLSSGFAAVKQAHRRRGVRFRIIMSHLEKAVERLESIERLLLRPTPEAVRETEALLQEVEVLVSEHGKRVGAGADMEGERGVADGFR